MTNEKSILSQIIEFHNLVSELTKEGNVLPERFVTHSLVDKFSDSWKEYKLQYTHNRTYLSLQQTIVDTKIKERNKKIERESSAKELALKANIVEIRPSKPPQFHKKNDFKTKGKFQKKNEGVQNFQIQKKKRNCFICG
jgi:hypothetical protein